jgi:hypothetical protein
MHKRNAAEEKPVNEAEHHCVRADSFAERNYNNGRAGFRLAKTSQSEADIL